MSNHLPFQREELEKDFKKIANCTLFYSKEKKRQFEHFHFLHLNASIEDDDIVCFLDDDDSYHPEKVEKVQKAFKNYTKLDGIRHCSVKFGDPWSSNESEVPNEKNSFSSPINNEYCNLCITGSLFHEWFDNCKLFTNLPFDELIKEFKSWTDCIFTSSFNHRHIENIKDVLLFIRASTIERAYKYDLPLWE